MVTTRPLYLADLKEKFDRQKQQLLRDFFIFLRFESIATDPAYKQHVFACKNWIIEYLSDLGMNIETWETENAPTIFAEDLRAGPDKPTLLLYNHYDVQPVDPLDLWTSPPFEPTVRGNEVYARGASDNKGQCFYTLFALKTLIEHHGHLPINIKYLIEGEEESGSANLFDLLNEKKGRLKADHLLIIDSGIEEKSTPAITLGARGISCMTVTIKGSNADLHSGLLGGIAYNPNRALVEVLATLHDETGAVNISGFYDEVVEMPPQERKELDFDFDEKHYYEMFGVSSVGMEKGTLPLEANWLRPTLEINGISGGYTGAGFKTVIPAIASAKISCRLVPYQNPHRISSLLQKTLEERLPEGFTIDVEIFAGRGPGFRTSPNSPIAKVMAEVYTDIYQKPCKRILIGGSIPIGADLAEASGADMVLVGVSLPDDQVHAPDEHFGIDRLEKGFLSIAHAIERLSR